MSSSKKHIEGLALIQALIEFWRCREDRRGLLPLEGREQGGGH